MCFTHQNPSYSERGDVLERGGGGGQENLSEGTGGKLNRGGGVGLFMSGHGGHG